MIPAWVSRYVGLPFQSHGRGPAFDCWGLVRYVLKEHYEIEAPDFSELYRNTEDKIGIAAAIDCGKDGWQKVDKEQPGDVIIITYAGRPMHCGLVVGPRCMLHARPVVGSCVENYDRPAWNRKIEGFYRRVCT